MPVNFFIQELEKIKSISDDLKDFLQKKLNLMVIEKNNILYKQDLRVDKVYYILSGLIIGNIFIEDRQHTCWFAKEGDFIMDIYSFKNNSTARLTAIAEEKTSLLYLSYADMSFMLNNFPEANYITRDLMAHYHWKDNQRTELMMLLKTVDRYKKFSEQQQWALKRIKLGYIASYLNMTRE